MESDEHPGGSSAGKSSLFNFGFGPECKVPRVLAIGLESSSSRHGGLNRYFSQLVGALGELGVPIVGLVTGDRQAHDELEWVEIVASPSASLFARLRAISGGVHRHADTDIVDVHFALTALPLLFGHLRRRSFVVHFQGPWADESALAGEGRLVCAEAPLGASRLPAC